MLQINPRKCGVKSGTHPGCYGILQGAYILVNMRDAGMQGPAFFTNSSHAK